MHIQKWNCHIMSLHCGCLEFKSRLKDPSQFHPTFLFMSALHYPIFIKAHAKKQILKNINKWNSHPFHRIQKHLVIFIADSIKII